jgi:hypothetical protein
MQIDEGIHQVDEGSNRTAGIYLNPNPVSNSFTTILFLEQPVLVAMKLLRNGAAYGALLAIDTLPVGLIGRY